MAMPDFTLARKPALDTSRPWKVTLPAWTGRMPRMALIGALAAAVVAEDADDLTLVDVEVDVEHDLLAAVARAQLLDDEDGSAGLAVLGRRGGQAQAVPK